ncbi:NUDIX hydrolase domain-like protein [Rhypophila decipiens]
MSSYSIPNFSFSSSLNDLNVSLKTYLSGHPTVARLIVCAIVIHKSSHVLLVQRAATDGFPNCWECPGGGVDNDDETILHALARELHEETGLVVSHVRALVDDKTEFKGREGTWRKITCLVEVNASDADEEYLEMPKVSLEPLEHQDFVWASEEDIERGRVGEKEIKFAYQVQKETIKLAFGMAKEGSGSG